MINLTIAEEFAEGEVDSRRIEAFLSEYGELVPHLVDDVRQYSQKLALLGCSVIVKNVTANQDVGMIGFYANDPKRKYAYISKIIVAASYHGTGLSGTLMNKAIDLCIARKFENIGVTVLKSNLRALNFYLKNGFVSVEELPNASLYMRKELT